ncbi:InlB B-repeat-containing protein [Bacteroides eggerthii]|nr:hypothetical protein [Bacteroides eggerthii]
MRKVKFLLLAALTAMFVGCQSDEVLEQDSGNDRPTPTGDTRITIEGEGMKDVTTRSSDGRVDFAGGYATGAGLYNGTSTPTVAAYPNPGYEVNYFYGGPANEPQKYDYAQSSASSFEVKLDGQDHRFHCGFKEKKRNLTVNAGTGGSVFPSGTNSYQVENAINITATPNTGYRFSGWTVTGGDVTIANSGSSSTTATLHSSNSTITARFEVKILNNYIKGEMSVYSSKSLQLKVTSGFPITSPITIKYSARGMFYVDEQDEWGGMQPPDQYFDCRVWTETLTVGQSAWEFIFMPDEMGTNIPYLPGKAVITSLDDWYMDFKEFSDDRYNYLKW